MKEGTNMYATEIKPEYIEVAKQIMENIQNDCGAANRFEGGFKYPEKWIKVISFHSQKLFEAHPELLTDDFLEEISCGGEEVRAELRGKFPEYINLDCVLEKYFESL